MADAAAAVGGARARRGGWLGAIARQRELSLVAIMVVLGALVSLQAPQFLTLDNLSQVAVLASVIAVAAVGEALVVITRNVDLSVEATIGLVAYCVASDPRAPCPRRARRDRVGHRARARPRDGQRRRSSTLFRVPAIVATLGTLSVFRGIDYLIAGSHQVPLAGLPDGFTERGPRLGPRDPDLRRRRDRRRRRSGPSILRSTRFGRQVYAVGSNPEAAAILGIPSRLVVFVAFSLCGLLAGVAGVLWVMEFGTINGTAGDRRPCWRSSPRSSSAA